MSDDGASLHTRPHDWPRDPDPTPDDARVLAEHRWAVRVNLPTDLGHVAALARRAIAAARYASLPVQEDIDEAAELLERWATQVAHQVDTERRELATSGLDAAAFQLKLEQGGQPDQQ
jgi:hypothetical protein